MASGSESHERARADRLLEDYKKNEAERELANARIEYRANMRSSSEEEDTGVINLRVEQAQARGELPRAEESEPPARVTIWAVTYMAAKRVPPWGIVIVLSLAIASYTVMRLAGVVKWP